MKFLQVLQDYSTSLVQLHYVDERILMTVDQLLHEIF